MEMVSSGKRFPSHTVGTKLTPPVLGQAGCSCLSQQCGAVLLPGHSRRLGLPLPSSAAQAAMNIQELERCPHLWRSEQGLAEEPLVRPPVRPPQALSCPLLPAVPSRAHRGGRQPWPSCTGHGSAWASSSGPFGAATQWDFSLIGCRVEGLSGTAAAERARPRRTAVTAWPISAELCLRAPQPPEEQVPAKRLSGYGELAKDV